MSDSEFVIHRDDDDHVIPVHLPLLPLRDVVVFPHMVIPLFQTRLI